MCVPRWDTAARITARGLVFRFVCVCAPFRACVHLRCVRVCVYACGRALASPHACMAVSLYVSLCMCVFTLAQHIGSLFLASNRDFNVFCLAVLAAHTLAFALGQHVFPPRPPPPGGSPMAVNAGASGSEGETRVQVAPDGSRAAAVQQDGSGRALPGSGERAAGVETLVLPAKMDPAELPPTGQR